MRQHRPHARGPVLVPLLLLLTVAVPVRADIVVRATVNTTQAHVGESITFVLTVEGAQDVPAPPLRVGGLDARYVGPSTQISIVNGKMSSSVQHRYSLFALQPGRFEVGPITIQYQGKDYSTAPLAVEFVAAGTPPATAGGANAGVGVAGGPQGKTLFATLSTSRPEVYLHERIGLDIDLYIGAVRAGDLQFPNLLADGLAIDDWPQPTQRQQVIDGQSYQVIHFHTMATPVRAGTLSIGPATLRLNVYERNRGNGRGGINDPFFDSFFQQARQVEVRADPVELSVLPLPEVNRPAGFSGAVGSFQMEVSAAPVDITAGDPITVQLLVHGEGNLSDAAPPQLTDDSGFRLYEPRPTTTEPGRRSFEQVVIPNDTTTRSLPPFRFSFFDPKTTRYQVIESAPIALQVHAPAAAPRTDIVAAGETARRIQVEEKLGRDIVFIKDDPGSLDTTAWRRNATWILIVWLPLPPLLLGLATWYDHRRRRLSGDERYARFTRAGKRARHGLGTARTALSNDDRGAFYEAIATTLREYLSAKLDLPAGGVDAEAVESRGCSTEVVADLRRLLALCETARFAPSIAGDDLKGTLQLAESIVARVERERRSSSPSLRVAALLCMGLVPAMVPLIAPAEVAPEVANAAASPHTVFFHANNLYRGGDYTAAAREYEELRRSGADSLSLHFNLGNAYFKSGDKGRAILSYERALRHHPGDPDVQSNLAYARSLTGAEGCPLPVWQRFAFPLAQRLSFETLWWLTTLAYSFSFLMLIAQRLLPRAPRGLSYMVGASAVLALLAGSSWSRQLYELIVQQTAVVVANGETTVRFEPADNGTAHFTLQEGSNVRVLDQRDAWLQIARCDGRRGWVAAASTERL